MPLVGFEYKGERYSLEDALERGALTHRFALTFLRMVAAEREWDGTPSVTQCINGTRMEYLKMTTDYWVNPDDSAFMALGSRVHLGLDSQGVELSEFDVRLDDLKGTLDLLEPAPGGGYLLTDYKTSGSFKVAKALGWEKVDVGQVDSDGSPVLYKSGKKKGQQVTKKEVRKGKPDIWEWALQVNKYRLMARAALDAKGDRTKIVAMRIFVISRDGGTWMAESRGVVENTASIPIEQYSDAKVEDYFERKSGALVEAMVDERLPGVCSEIENWQGRRCRDYCPVADACKAAGDNPHLGGVRQQLEDSIAEATNG